MHPRSPLPELLAQLNEDRASLLAAVARLPAGLLHERPSSERWSVAEVVEHLSIVEPRVVKLMEGLVATAPPLSPNAFPTEPLRVSRRLIMDRSQRIVAPPPLQPQPGIGAQAGLAKLDASRAELLTALERAYDLDLGAVSHAHPVFGLLNGFQWISFQGGHEARHTAQIVEVANALMERGERLPPLS